MTRPLHLKVCGVTTSDQLHTLALGGASLAGLWWHIPGSARSLSGAGVVELATSCREIDGLEPVLVTFSSDAMAIAQLMLAAQINWVQLHAFQRPALVRELRELLPAAAVIAKVFHFQAGVCLEQPFFDAYRRAGCTVIIFDATSGDGRIGSTGEQIPAPALLAAARTVELPFLVAGGVAADNAAYHPDTRRLPGYLGVDADSATRGPDGDFSPWHIDAIRAAWWAPVPVGTVPR